ncbi:TetR/AcrR family transcriptional regulator [Paludibacter sp.]|uniref:TetR/AcrR family transcriptional regulator n=1 Tax=Paludibacter sp. TaxID=1898105 RepID=UPI001352BDAD|nr:TetR/AcrR family transcriptional regulator [Paludibacter sp.]MTK53079.1 TetR/AcrR family transcriptional regulator [Paludibacter sp.]
MTQEQEAGLEQKILETAEQLFLEKGFAMTSTTEIAKKAGCNQALVHYYFRTKENLFQSIFEQKIRLLISSFQDHEMQNLTFEEKLKRKIETHFEMIRANPRLPFLVMNEFTTNPSRLEAFRIKIIAVPQAVFHKLEEELNEEIRAGRIRDITVMDLVLNIVSLNAMLFLTGNIFKCVAQLSEEQYQMMIEHRKQEHVKVILASLRP